MKKQIIYPPFILRIFAMAIDMVILSVLITPIMGIISQYVFIFTFQDYFLINGINTSDAKMMATAVKTPEFMNQISASQFFSYTTSLFAINIFMMGAYFIIFWRKLSATPGKIIMRLKIVNADDYSAPTAFQLIKRFLGYITALIGIWSILFSKRGIAMHDKIANTVVIKS